MFESPLVAKFIPQMMNKFEEGKTTREMVKLGVEKGYKISRQTPNFLYGYEEVLELFFNTPNSYIYVKDENFAYMLKVENRRQELIDYILNNYSYIYMDFKKYIDVFKDIEVNDKTVGFIKSKLGFAYLKENPEFMYTDYFSFSSYSSYHDDICKLVIERDLDIKKVLKQDDVFFAHLIKFKPELLLDTEYRYFFNKLVVEMTILRMIKDGDIGLENLTDKLVFNSNIFEALIEKDFTNLDKIIIYNDSDKEKFFRIVVSKFVKQLPESLEYLPNVSSFVEGSYYIESYQRTEILNAIKEKNYYITHCCWDFVLKDKEIVLNSIRNNPSVLNTCANLLRYVSLTAEETEEIVNIVINNNMVLYIFHEAIMKNEKLAKYAFDVNPDLLTHSKTIYYDFDEKILQKLLNDGAVDVNARTDNTYGKIPYYLWIDAIRRNPYNVLSLNGRLLTNEQALEIFHVYLEHDVPLLNHMIHSNFSNGFENNPRIVLEALKQKKLSFNRNYYLEPSSHSISKWNAERNMLNFYLLANDDGQLKDIVRSLPNIPSGSLGNDFEYKLNRLSEGIYIFEDEEELNEEQQKRVCEVYLKNRDVFIKKLRYKHLKNNIYIIANEMIIYDNYSSNLLNIEVVNTKKFRDYFTEELKKHNKKVNRDNIKFITDIDLLLEYGKNNFYELVEYIDNNNFTNEEIEKINKLFLDKIREDSIDLRYVSASIILSNFETIKDVVDCNDLIFPLYNTDENIEECQKLISRIYKEGKCNLSFYVFNSLDYDDAVKLLKERPHSLIEICTNHRVSSESVQEEIDKIFSDENLHKVSYVDSYNYSPLEIYELLNNGYYTTKDLVTLYNKGMIDINAYNYYYSKILVDIMNGKIACSDELSDIKYNYEISYYFLDYCFNKNFELFCSLLRKINFDNNRLMSNLIQKLDVSSGVKKERILNSLSHSVKNIIFKQRTDLIEKYNFDDFFISYFKKCYIFTENEIYDIWVQLNKPIEANYLENEYILRDILANDKEKIFDIFDTYKNEKQMLIIYEAFKDDKELDIFKSPLLFENVYFVNETLNTKYSFDDYYLDDMVEAFLFFCKDNKKIYDYYCSSYKKTVLDKYVNKLLKDEPLKLVDIFTYETYYTHKISNKLIEIGYLITKDTPQCYITEELIDYTLRKNPDAIVDIIDKISINQRLYYYDLIPYISKLLIEREIYNVKNYDLLSYSEDYLKEFFRHNPRMIDEIPIYSLNDGVVFSYFEIVLELIRDGKYQLSEKTAKALLYNEEIYDLAKKTNPKLLEGFELASSENINRDNRLIWEAIEKPTEINTILAGREKVCEESLLNKLVSKLISINYIPSDETPEFLYSSYKFMEYCILNNYVIDENRIRKFTTFENLYKTKNVELFKRLINQGFGLEFRKVINCLGLDTTFELSLEYGYLLNFVNYGNVRVKEDFYKELFRYFDSSSNYIPDIITRCIEPSGKFSYLQYNFYLNELVKLLFEDKTKYAKHIDELIKIDFCFSKTEMPFVFEDEEFIERMVTFSNYPRSLTGFVNNLSDEKLTDKIILLAMKNGYKINSESHQKILKNSEYVNFGLKYLDNVSEVKKLVNKLESDVINMDIINTISTKYFIEEDTPDFIKNNPDYIRLFLEKATTSSVMKKLIASLDDKILDLVINEENINLLSLYFLDYYSQDQYLPLCEKFHNVLYDKKRSLILKMISDMRRINRVNVHYAKYVFENFERLEIEDLDKVINCLYRIENSNSGEVRQFATSIISELLAYENYEEKFVSVEKIFLQAGLPMVSKLFSVFKILHFDYTSFDNYNNLSPVLKSSDKEERDKIIQRDLIISALFSNNRSLKEYLNTMNQACVLIKDYETGKIAKDNPELKNALNFLVAIINSEYIINHIDKELVVNDVDDIISTIKRYFNYVSGDLRDSIVQFLFNFQSYDLIFQFMNEVVDKVDRNNREKVCKPFVLERGDLVKGLGASAVNYLNNILQNGSVAKEFLGDSAGSDATPLDTDCSLIEEDTSDLEKGISCTEANTYGPIWIVVKKSSNNFIVSRTKEGDVSDFKYTSSKLEAFYTGVIGEKHYGIRTGFPSSMIDYFIVENFDQKLGLEIALNGFYIPVVSKKTGEVVFTPEMYDDLRAKMSGLAFFEAGSYRLASYEDLNIQGIGELMSELDANRLSIRRKHLKIKEAIALGVSKSNYELKDKLDGNLVPGFVDLIDTGSTARGTDLPGKADFDYICRVDRDLFVDEKKFSEFRKNIRNQFTSIETEEYAGNNFRFKGVTVPGLDEKVDIDISFIIRTTKLSLSSDESLLNRLNSISTGNYVLEDENDLLMGRPKIALDYVTANILLAKKLLKKFEAYKKHNSPEKQGGLGGIGIENWILQHGGSLKRAAEDFLRVANSCGSYNEFKQKYQVWDFGQNHYSFEKSSYSHDEFVYNNMNEAGYEKMKKALTLFLDYGTKVFDDDELKVIEAMYDERVVNEEKNKKGL